MLNNKSTTKPTGSLFLIGFIVSLLLAVLYLLSPSFVSDLNYKVTDLIRAIDDRNATDNSIVIIDVDEKSLAKYGQWPWPRNRLADLLRKVRENGAESIALDMILAESDRTSPLPPNVLDNLSLNNKLENNKVTVSSDNDKYLSDVLARGPYVLGYKFFFDKRYNVKTGGLHPLNLVQVQQKDAGTSEKIFQASGVISNLNLFSKSVSFSGFLNATPDSDGIIRRIPLIIQYNGKFFPSLSLATLMQFYDISSIQLRTEATGSTFVLVGKKKIPIDKHGNFLINFIGSNEKFVRISASDILDEIVSKDVLTGKFALVGSSASGLDHIYQTPGQRIFSHAAIHAHALETLLGGKFSVRDNWVVIGEVLAACLLGMLFCIFIINSGLVASGLVGGGLLIGLWFSARVIFQHSGYICSPLLPGITILTLYGVLNIIKTRRGQDKAEDDADKALMLLKDSEKTLNSIIGFIPDIIFRLDPNGKVIFISPAIAQYQRKEDEIVGQLIIDLVVPEDRNKAKYRVNERRTGNRSTKDLELRMKLVKKTDDPDKNEEIEYRYFHISAQGIYNEDNNDGKEFIGTQGIVRDITEQKKLEEKLLQAKKMEAVGSLAAGVAHDLNNILSGLVSYPDLLLLDIEEDSPLREKVGIIKQSGQKAAAIVQDMVTLARRGVANKQIFCPNKVVEEYFNSPEFSKLKGKNPQIKFETDLSKDLLNVNGSVVHLSKALMNIVTNACEAMPAGGTILVSSLNCYIDLNQQAYEEIPEGEYVQLRVKDSGVGIAAENLNRIFEPFYTKKKMGGSGTGLGMTVIWATVKDLGGYLDLKSKEGEGTTIDIYLNSTREVAAEANGRVVLEDYLGTEKVLVVDDIIEQQDIAVNMLTKLGYKVYSVANGEDAVDFIEKTPVDIVVLDMIMPNGMDGLQTYRKMIEIVPGQKAIIASGYSESERVKEVLRLGAGDYVQKPYTLEKIGVSVRKELDRN